VRAAQQVGEQLEAALGTATGWAVPEPAPRQVLDKVRVAAEGCRSRLQDLSRMCRPSLPEDLRLWILQESRRLLDEQFRLGQMLAAPQLVEQQQPGRRLRPAAPRLRAPGEAGFDQWCLTSPAYRSRLRSGRAARLENDRLWRCDPEPDRALGVQRQIEAALAAGSIRHTYSPGGLQRVFHDCPWGPIYEVVRPVRIAGDRLHTLTQFTYEVSADRYRQTGMFVRRLVRGPFVATGRMAGRTQPMRPDR
jgi:hypothetical protein